MTIRTRLRLLLLAALPLPLLAQDVVDATEETEEPEIRRYTVELIVFRYAEAFDGPIEQIRLRLELAAEAEGGNGADVQSGRATPDQGDREKPKTRPKS